MFQQLNTHDADVIFSPLGSSGDEREVRLCTGEQSRVLRELRELQQRRGEAALRREGEEAPQR